MAKRLHLSPEEIGVAAILTSLRATGSYRETVGGASLPSDKTTGSKELDSILRICEAVTGGQIKSSQLDASLTDRVKSAFTGHRNANPQDTDAVNIAPSDIDAIAQFVRSRIQDALEQ
jgi:hypothetical protein